MIIASLFSGMRIPIPPVLLFALLVLLFVAWIIFTLIIRYHWKKYGYSKLVHLKMNFVYFAGSGVLLLGMLLFAILYSIN